MSKWVTERLEDLLQQINEVPYTDDRDGRQLTILMDGFAQLNNEVMEKAAVKTKSQLSGWSLDNAVEKKKPKKTAQDLAEEANAELTKLRPIR